MLSAKITEEEADRICSEWPIKKENFCHIATAPNDPNSGDLIIRMPCRFLLGRTADYVSCRAYGGFRPKVCGDYLCRIAIQYKTGFIELDQALKDIKTAFRTGNPIIFNWTQSGDEGQLIKASMIPQLLKVAQDAYYAASNPSLSLEEVENVFVAEVFTPMFRIASPTDQLHLNMLFDIFDRGELELADILKPSLVEEIPPDARDLVEFVMLKVVAKFRTLFTKEGQ